MLRTASGVPVHGMPTSRQNLKLRNQLKARDADQQARVLMPASPQRCEDCQLGKHAAAQMAKPAERRLENHKKCGCKSPLVHITKSAGTILQEPDKTEGICTRTAPKLMQVPCEQTGELQSFKFDERTQSWVHVPSAEFIQRERYALQSVARQTAANSLNPRGGQWRVTYCLRHLLAGANAAGVMLNEKFRRAFFSHTQVCGSVWACPVCAAKISQRRQQEIRQAFDAHVATGGSALMITLTHGHHRYHSLAELFGSREDGTGSTGALHGLRRTRGYQKLCAMVGYVGLIRNLEVTHGEANGWHPHVHELWLCDKTLTADERADFKQEFFYLWRSECLEAGLPLPSLEHGVDVARAFSPEEYLQKWGREQRWGAGAELTKSHIKTSKNGKGRTPFDLLRLCREDGPEKERDAALYLEFITGTYGKRQCFWSHGLKKRFGIGELTDQQIVERQEEQATIVTSIAKPCWKALMKQPFDVRPKLLELAVTGGKQAVDDYVAELVPEQAIEAREKERLEDAREAKLAPHTSTAAKPHPDLTSFCDTDSKNEELAADSQVELEADLELALYATSEEYSVFDCDLDFESVDFVFKKHFLAAKWLSQKNQK